MESPGGIKPPRARDAKNEIQGQEFTFHPVGSRHWKCQENTPTVRRFVRLGESKKNRKD
jgi:hypothetical protein